MKNEDHKVSVFFIAFVSSSVLTNFLEKLQNRIQVTKLVALLQETSSSIHIIFLHYDKNYFH